MANAGGMIIIQLQRGVMQQWKVELDFKRKILITVLAVVGFDVVASVLSKLFQFDYTNLILASLLLYLAAGYWGALRRGFIFGIFLGALAGLADSTIGLFVSMWIGPFSRTGIPQLSQSLIFIVIITLTATGTILGLVGAGLCRGLTRLAPSVFG